MPMKKTRFLPCLLAIGILTLACRLNFGGRQVVEGSGVHASQEREVQEFSAIELAGSAEFAVTVGEEQSVVVEADDNILPFIETNVRGHTLVVNTKAFTTLNPNLPIRVNVTVKSLDEASLSGSGDITIQGIAAPTFKIELAGSGNITAEGTADSLTVSLNGSGNVACGDLMARSVTASIDGSGNVTVYTSGRLDATVQGSGTVEYRGDPAEVNQSVPGSGSVAPIP